MGLRVFQIKCGEISISISLVLSSQKKKKKKITRNCTTIYIVVSAA